MRATKYIICLAAIVSCAGCADFAALQKENTELRKQTVVLEAALKKSKEKIDEMSDDIQLLNNIVENKSVQECLEKEIDRLYLRGMELYLADKFQEAIDTWKNLLKLNPDHENAKIYVERAKRKLKGMQKFK